jgi:type I restriction enzyme S subunit
MKFETFQNIITDVTSSFQKIKKEDYLPEGKYAIIDQGQDFIGGFTNDEGLINYKEPLIIFGDHTKAIKFIDFPFTIGADGVKVLKPNLDKANTKFIFYYLKSINLPDAGYSRHFKFLKEIKVPLPPLEEQKHIAAVLSKAEALIAERKQSIQFLEEYLKSTFLEMFIYNSKNNSWTFTEIKNVVEKDKHAIKAGPFGSSLKKEFYVSKGYKIYGQEQVIKDDLNFGDYYINEELYKKLESCKVKEGDVLISLVGTYGKLSVIPKTFEPGIINPRLMKISFDKSLINTTYFKHLFRSEYLLQQLSKLSRGGTMDIINVGIVKDIKIPVPPLPLQTQFAQIVEKTEALKTQYKAHLQELEQLYGALSQRAFRGEMRAVGI